MRRRPKPKWMNREAAANFSQSYQHENHVRNPDDDHDADDEEQHEPQFRWRKRRK